MARVNQQHHTPGVSILGLSAWVCPARSLAEPTISFWTYVIFASWMLYGMTTAAVIVLRRKRPDLPRPYRTLGYPVVPVLFVVMSAAIRHLGTLYNSPRESLLGLVIDFYRVSLLFSLAKTAHADLKPYPGRPLPIPAYLVNSVPNSEQKA